jgi:hypothetical protein
MQYLPAWGTLIAACSNSGEVEVFGRKDDTWEQYVSSCFFVVVVVCDMLFVAHLLCFVQMEFR